MQHLLVTLTLLGLAATAPAQLILTANTGQSRLTALSPVDGSVVIPNVFPLVNTAQVSAIDVNGEIWISEQTGDRITRRNLAGTILGTIGPTFTGSGLDNIRGMAFVGGIVYVTNSGSANGAPGPNALVCFDSSGNWLFNVLTTGTAPSPFAVMPFQGDILVSSSSGASDVHRFTTAGVPVGVFHDSAAIAFAHQLAQASDGNVWCGGFTTGGIVKLDATTGAVISTFPAANIRGVYELANGNILWTNSSGAHVYDIATSTSTMVVSGACYHLNPYFAGAASATTYGTGCDGLGIAAVGMPVLGNSAFALDITNVPVVSPIGFVAAGTQSINPGFDLTVIGMPGCFAYTTFDIGLFSGGLVVGGISTFALPIPGTLSLNGTSLALQGVSLSLATPAGLAASNGIAITVGK
jgi:hypothetical protein